MQKEGIREDSGGNTKKIAPGKAEHVSSIQCNGGKGLLFINRVYMG